jgi:hypothetical protein
VLKHRQTLRQLLAIALVFSRIGVDETVEPAWSERLAHEKFHDSVVELSWNFFD